MGQEWNPGGHQTSGEIVEMQLLKKLDRIIDLNQENTDGR